MLGNSGDAVLDDALEPLLAFLKRKNLVELSCNRPGEIWSEIAGEGWRCDSAPALSLKHWSKLCYILANKAGQRFDIEEQPFVSTRLPGGHRFEANLGKSVRSGVSVSIRMKRKIQLEYEDFGLGGEYQARVLDDIAAGANVVISGGTSSGKTTLFNKMIEAIPSDRRIISMEDTAELDVPHRNRVEHDLARHSDGGSVGYAEKFDHAMRSRPDQILLGELSMKNAFPALLLLNSGHRGFMMTMHADSAHLALEEGFYQRIALSGHGNVGQEYLASYLRKTVDLVIQIAKVERDKRRITELWWPVRNEHRRLTEKGALAA